MKIEIEAKELAVALRQVTKGISKNKVEKSLPVLNSVLIDVKTVQPCIVYTNLDIRTAKALPCTVNEAGKTLINRLLLERVLGFLPVGANLIISVHEKKTIIKSGNAEFELVGHDPQDFPESIHIPLSRVLRMPGKDLAAMLKRCLPSINLSDSRKVLNGVYIESDGDEALRFVATDGKRCVITRTNVQEDTSDVKSIISYEAAKKLVSLFEHKEGNVKINLGINQPIARFSDENVVFTTKTIEGNYPSYRNIFPAEYKFSISLNRKELLNKIEAFALFGKSNRSSFVSLRFTSENLRLSMIVDGNKFSDLMNVSGENLPFGQYNFNAAYLAVGLKSCSDETIKILCNNPESPVLFDGENYEYLIMPMLSR